MNFKEGNINWGTLGDIPEISVDRFGSLDSTHVDWNTSRGFFLTHYDNEICSDILNEEFLNTISNVDNNCRIYLHELAFHYLKYWTSTMYVKNGDYISLKLDQLKDAGQIIFLETNHTIRLHFKCCGKEDRSVDVTAISSGSNIGCIMLLFEDSLYKKRILYTGDCRLTLNDLQQCQSLHNLNGSVKKLTKLYLDTTYCIEDAKELPSRNQVTKEILNIVMDQAQEDSTKHFEMVTQLKVEHLKFLHMLAQISVGGVHVPPDMAQFLDNVPEFKHLVHWGAGMINRAHYDCGDSCDYENCAYGLEWGLHFDVLTLDIGCNLTYHLDSLKTERADEKEWCGRNQKMVYYYNGTDNLRGIYSSHLSRFELGRLVNYFKMDLENIVPLHKSPKMAEDEFLILLEMGCADAPEEPNYFQQELPSHFYDFTSSNPDNKDSSLNSSKEIQQYNHEIKKLSQ